LNAGLIRAVGIGFILMFLAGAPAQENPDQHPQPAGSSEFVKITPGSLDFGSQPVGALTAPKTATLANNGPKSLTITDIVTSGIDFAQTNTCGQSLAPGANCTIQITFKPAITGPRIATVQILDSDPASPQSIVLNGTGQ
jgi:Transmembrane protein 131-like N-terminal